MVVISGASFTLVTVTVNLSVSLRPPLSVSFTVTTYSLSVSPDWPGVSKSGWSLKERDARKPLVT